MLTEVEWTLVTLIHTYSRDTPPHLDSNSILEVTDLKVNKFLKSVEGPIDNIPEGTKIANFKSEDIPGLFSPHHCVEVEAKLRIMKAIKLGHNYLHQPTLKQGLDLTHSNFQ